MRRHHIHSSVVRCDFNKPRTFGPIFTQFRPKQDVRNTINDIFILATALDACAELVTKDSSLARFAGKVFGVRLQSRKDHDIMDFSRNL